MTRPVRGFAMQGDTKDREPVRLTGWGALAVGLTLNALLMWALDLDFKAVVAVTSSMSLTSIGGLEWARSRVTPTGKD